MLQLLTNDQYLSISKGIQILETKSGGGCLIGDRFGGCSSVVDEGCGPGSSFIAGRCCLNISNHDLSVYPRLCEKCHYGCVTCSLANSALCTIHTKSSGFDHSVAKVFCSDEGCAECPTASSCEACNIGFIMTGSTC